MSEKRDPRFSTKNRTSLRLSCKRKKPGPKKRPKIVQIQKTPTESAVTKTCTSAHEMERRTSALHHSNPVKPEIIKIEDDVMEIEDDVIEIESDAEGFPRDQATPIRTADEECEDEKKKRNRTKFSHDQLQALERVFEQTSYPEGRVKEELARNLGVTKTRVRVWFANRRAKIRKDQISTLNLKIKDLAPPVQPLAPHHNTPEGMDETICRNDRSKLRVEDVVPPENPFAPRHNTETNESVDMEFEYHSIKREEADYPEADSSEEVMDTVRASTKGKRCCCEVCDYETTKMSRLDDHMNIHTGERPHGCLLCDMKFRNRTTLYMHRKNFHQGRKPLPYSCHVCEYSVNRLDYFKKHMGTHSLSEGSVFEFSKEIPDPNIRRSENFEGPVCNERLESESPAGFTCILCKHSSTTVGESVTHMKLHMDENLKYFCEECDFTATTPRRLKSHKRAHVLIINMAEEYRFDVRNSKTPTRIEIRDQKQTHINTGFPRRYDCIECNASYPTLESLQGHIRTHIA